LFSPSAENVPGAGEVDHRPSLSANGIQLFLALRCDTVIDDAAIEDAGRRLAAAAGAPATVVLFGSRARGNARDDSDLDFLVIEAQVDSKLTEMVRLRDALPPLGVPVDVVVVSEEEAARREMVPSTLVHRALREGRVLVTA